MRIVYLAHYAGGADAASAMDADLVASLREQGHVVVVLSPFRNPAAGRLGGSVAVGRLPRLLLAIPGYLRMVRDALRLAPGSRIVSQYQAFQPATATAFLVARLRGEPLVVRAHDPLPGSYRSALEDRVDRVLFRAYRGILRHRDTWVQVPSPELLDLAASRMGLPRDRLAVVPNTVAPAPALGREDAQRLREELGLARVRIVLQFGSFTRAGMRTLVGAVAELGRPDVKGVVLTDPDRGAAFAREARRVGVADRFLVLRTRPPAEVREFLAAADVCVGILSAHPTARGAVPRSTLEAMAAGRPVVMCRGVVSTSLAEDGRNCLLVPPEDPAALARAIARLLDDFSFAASVGSRARETVRARFAADAVARTFASLLAALPASPRA